MDQIAQKANRPASQRDPSTEVRRLGVPQSQPTANLRGHRPSSTRAHVAVSSANTPEGEEATMAELTGVRVTRMKHLKVDRELSEQEVLELAETNAATIVKNMVENSDKTRKRAKTEAEKLAEQIENK